MLYTIYVCTHTHTHTKETYIPIQLAVIENIIAYMLVNGISTNLFFQIIQTNNTVQLLKKRGGGSNQSTEVDWILMLSHWIWPLVKLATIQVGHAFLLWPSCLQRLCNGLGWCFVPKSISFRSRVDLGRPFALRSWTLGYKTGKSGSFQCTLSGNKQNLDA